MPTTRDYSRTPERKRQDLERRSQRCLKHAHDGTRTLTRAAHVRAL